MMSELLSNLSALSTFVISGVCAVHVAFFCLLWIWSRRDLRTIASSLDHFTRNLKHRSILDATSHFSDQIEAFLADINEVLADDTRAADRTALLERINYLDEKRQYVHSMLFQTSYNICRTMIEAYPLAGVLGTILAIGAALQTGTGDAATSAVNAIVGRFGEAIWSTFAGLSAAILLMFLNSIVEPSFSRLGENQSHVRDTVAKAKRELSLSGGDSA